LAQSVPRERLWLHVLGVDASQVMRHLRAAGAALIDVVEVTGLTAGPQLVAFVVNGRPDVPIALVQLGSSEHLARLVDPLVAAIANDEPLETWQHEAGVLGQLLIGGVACEGAARELLFAPEGPLVNLPIDALVLGDGKFVLDRFACRVVLCGREAMPDRQSRRQGSDTVVVGNPAFDTVVPAGDGLHVASGNPFGELPGAQEECAVVGSLLRGATVLCGQQATRAALQALRSPELLHVATHGFAVPRGEASVIDAFGRSLAGIADPLLRCGLAMAQANGFDPQRENRSEAGILWGTDILELDVRGTELVFLSACHSGVGDVTIGPAAGSLALAFWLAGARSIVMTRWEITDLVAAELARAFYERVVKAEPYVLALRAAKLSVKADGAAASDWAGYALLGEAEPLFTHGGLFVRHIDGNKLMAQSGPA
jgi:CHAT domain-containing protein